MFYFYTILFFIFGLVIGSFLNVIILRIDDLKSVISSRSHCPNCKKTLAWYDLIPLLSFIVLRGKCRSCGKAISLQYPLVEFFTGLLFVFLFLMFGLTLTAFFYLIIFSLLAVVFVYDLKFQMVPEIFVWIVVILSLLGGWYFGVFGFWNMLLGGLIGGGFLALLVLVSNEKWMGAGDIKIGLILGFLCGYPNVIFGIFSAFILGSIVGLFYIGMKKKTLKTALPFAPFLILATLIAVTYGRAVISWYWGSYF